MDKNLIMAHSLAEEVLEKGGCCYYVGGFVRDRLMGIENKDVDVEVHGLKPAELAAVLDKLGERVEMGASFGVYGLKHYDLDIAMPRSEKAIGKGHRDFEVFVDPFIGTKKAAQRRDFTVNAMMENVLTGEIIDHFGGREDLKNGILRHVNSKSFVEDELRVLRGAQFAARFGFTFADETVRLCSGMELSSLPAERVMGEIEKALLKSKSPSVFFEALKKMNKLSFWLKELESCQWKKTMAALDCAAELRLSAEKPLYFMLAALCVNIEEPKALINRLTAERELSEYVLNMCALCKEPSVLIEKNGDSHSWNTMFFSSLCPSDLLVLDRVLTGSTEYEKLKYRRLREYEELISKPCVMGRDLIKAGLRPGKNFRQILDYANDLRLAGVEKASALEMTLDLYGREHGLSENFKDGSGEQEH